MSAPQELNISFRHKDCDYAIHLVKGEKSDQCVQINGISYAVLGDKDKLETACKILNSIHLDSISSCEELAERLSLIKDLTCAKAKTTHDVGVEVLNSKAKTVPIPKTMEQAYEELTQKLEEYAKEHIGQGALLVQVIGIKGCEKPQTFGQLSVDDATPVDASTIGRTGSGAKLWAGLLSTILTQKYPNHIQMNDTLGKFAPNEALRKFGTLSPDGHETLAPELAQEMTLEAIVGMTAGLEYEDRSPKESGSATLDEIMRGPAIEEGSIHLVYHPKDKVSVYSNNISLTAYPLEKAYKKVIADQLIATGELDPTQTLKKLSEQVEPLRTKWKQLDERIKNAEKHLERLKYQKDHTRSGSSGRAKKSTLNTQIEAHEKRLEGMKLEALKSNLKKLPPPIPESVLNLTLKDLLDSESAYIGPNKDVYVYDLIDQFLMKFDPKTLTTTTHHLVSYDEIMKRELLDPMGMNHTGFHGTRGTEMDVTFVNPQSKKQESKAPPHESVMLHGGGGGRTTLEDASKLAKGLADRRGLIDQNGETLLSQKDLHYLFTPHGHYKGWGLGGSELSCNGKFIEKGGSFDQDTYTFWVDRSSGVGLIAMCNCGKRPVHILDAFKNQVKNISHPDVQDSAREKEETPILIALQEYHDHPLENPTEYYEGTRGKIALLFDPDKEDTGIMHWSGTPLQLVKQKDDGSGQRRFCIATPGRFENVEVWKVKGAHNDKQEYLAVGDTSFIKTTTEHIPSQESVAYAKSQFGNFAGDYINNERPDWGIFRFDLKGEGENIYLCACDIEDKGQRKPTTPLGIIKVERNAISFNGHDRQPPDKIFRFVRNSESEPWRLQVTDVASPNVVIEERAKLIDEED